MASSSSLRRYLANSLANLFAGAWEPQPEGPLPLDIPQASPQQVTYLCSLARDPPPPPNLCHMLSGFSLNQYRGCQLGGFLVTRGQLFEPPPLAPGSAMCGDLESGQKAPHANWEPGPAASDIHRQASVRSLRPALIVKVTCLVPWCPGRRGRPWATLTSVLPGSLGLPWRPWASLASWQGWHGDCWAATTPSISGRTAGLP